MINFDERKKLARQRRDEFTRRLGRAYGALTPEERDCLARATARMRPEQHRAPGRAGRIADKLRMAMRGGESDDRK